MANLLAVHPSLVQGIWPHARGMVRRGMSRADQGSFERTEREVLTGLQQLWITWNGAAIEAVAVTQLTTAGDKKICVVVACSGKGDWSVLISGLERFASDEGCRAVRIYGRRGWLRALESYREKYVVMDKELI